MVDVASLRDVLANLDVAHGELVHSTLLLHFIRSEWYEQTERRKMEKYKKLCISFFRLSRTLLPQLADYACVLLARMYESEMALTRKHARYDEAEKTIWRLALRRIRLAETRPLTAYLNSTYSHCLPTHDLKDTVGKIAPVLELTTDYVNKREFYWAIGNLMVLFRVLHKISKWHPEWYKGMVSVDACDLGMMLALARGLYCKMRAMEGLPASVAEEMDARAVVMNARYDMMFGGWEEMGFTDMVKGSGKQTQDYSLVEKWPMFAPIFQLQNSMT